MSVPSPCCGAPVMYSKTNNLIFWCKKCGNMLSSNGKVLGVKYGEPGYNVPSDEKPDQKKGGAK